MKRGALHRRRVVRLISVASLLPAVAGAQGGSAPGQGTGDAARGAPAPARSDTIVRVAGAPLHLGEASLVEELTIGVVSGAPEYEFGRVRDILPARDGTVWIIDGAPPMQPGATRLRQYDARGRYLQSVGRVGQGPGEFNEPANLGQLPDGRILLYQPMPSRRVIVYSERGAHDTTWTLSTRVSSGTFASNAFRVDSSGIGYAFVVMLRTDGRGATQTTTREFGTLRIAPTGAIIDTIPAPADIPHSVGRVTVFPFNFTPPYAPVPLWAWSPLGYWVSGVPTSYAFELRIPPRRTGDAGAPLRWSAGDPVVSIRRTGVPRIEISDAERRDQTAYIDATIARFPGPREGTLSEVPRVKPAYHELLIADDGRMWVRAAAPSERYDPPRVTDSRGAVLPAVGWRERQLYDVFEPEGAYVGRVAVAHEVELYTMRGDTVWGTVKDADDVQVVKRFRIAWR